MKSNPGAVGQFSIMSHPHQPSARGLGCVFLIGHSACWAWKISMHFSCTRRRTLVIGVVFSLAFITGDVREAVGESESLNDANHVTKALHHKHRRKTSMVREVDLAWAPSPSSPNIDGYRVYYGTASGRYSEHVDVGLVTTAKLPSPANGNTYFYIVVAYKGLLESPPSNEVISSTALPAPTNIADEPTTPIFPGPSPSPRSPSTSSRPAPASVSASLPESTQVVNAPDVTAAATPTLRFQRRLQRLGIQPRESNQAGSAAQSEPAHQ